MRRLVQQIYEKTHWGDMTTLADWVIDIGIQIQQIPAPTFAEERRANFICDIFRTLGLTDVEVDSQYNAYGRLVGTNANAPALLVSAHSDTVFPAETDLSIREDGDFIYGAGLGDNSIGVAGLLGILKWYQTHQIKPPCDIWFVATSCEEGLGDLKGMRRAYERLRERVGAVINLEGLAFGYVFHAGIAVYRVKITANAEGGHSWIHFGKPSATHAISQLGAQITQITPPTTPRTTYNIGMIEGGSAINAVAGRASMWLDMRSEEQATLNQLVEQVRAIMRSIEGDGLRFDVEVVGERPSGSIALAHPLVQGALEALELLGVRGGLETGSTDANIPLAQACPAITVGITKGANAHRLDEYIERKPVLQGVLQAILITRATTRYLVDPHTVV